MDRSDFRAIFDQLLREEEDAKEQWRGTGEREKGESPIGKWRSLFSIHPESGGAFGGRNNAAVRLVGFFRAKSIPHDAAQLFAKSWNNRYCVPPLPEVELSDLISRAWAEWAEGGLEDVHPEEQGPIPFLTFADMEEEEKRVGPMTWIVENGLPSRGLVYVSAPPAGAKTWVLLDLVRAACTGGKWLGEYDVPQVPILYLDEEMGVTKALPRLRKLGVPPDAPFFYTNRYGVRIDDNGHLKQIAAFIEERGIQIVVIDTLTRVHRYDENDNSQMRQLFARFGVLMNAGACLVIAHHDRKGGQGESSIGLDRMRGASEISASADMCFSIEKKGDYFHLVTTKSRLVSEEEGLTLDFIVEDNEDRSQTTLRPVDGAEMHEKRMGVLSERILALIERDGSMSTGELKEAMGGKHTNLIDSLTALVRQGLLVVDKEGNMKVYRLP